jgi:hypothetical protein
MTNLLNDKQYSLIDDGSHMVSHQKISFKYLFEHIKPDGVYLCEDLHTPYYLKFGGGFRRYNTFIEFSKKLIDYLNALYSEQKKFKPNRYT